jgi:hypothetical protein
MQRLWKPASAACGARDSDGRCTVMENADGMISYEASKAGCESRGARIIACDLNDGPGAATRRRFVETSAWADDSWGTHLTDEAETHSAAGGRCDGRCNSAKLSAPG